MQCKFYPFGLPKFLENNSWRTEKKNDLIFFLCLIQTIDDMFNKLYDVGRKKWKYTSLN